MHRRAAAYLTEKAEEHIKEDFIAGRFYLPGFFTIFLCRITASHSDKFYVFARATACHQKSDLHVKHLCCIHEVPSPTFVYFLYLVDFSLLLSQGVLGQRFVYRWENTLNEYLHRTKRLVKVRTCMQTVSLAFSRYLISGSIPPLKKII